MNTLKTIIFDLDGVLVDTAKYHYLAWKQVAEEQGLFFDEQTNEKLKGVSRVRSLKIILEENNRQLPEEITQSMLVRKNDAYLEYISQLDTSAVLPGIDGLIAQLKEAGLNIVLGSASKNAAVILESTQLMPLFDHIVDGNMVANAKPDPEVFLKGAELTNTDPKQCLVFEDAQAGVEAAIAAGMKVVGIGSVDQLGAADLVIADATSIKLPEFLNSYL